MTIRRDDVSAIGRPDESPQVYLRLVFPDYTAIGPHGLGFLEAVRDCGSIGAAARTRRLTYRQGWLVTRNLNTMFRGPLVATRPGRCGGATVTPLGHDVITLFRDAERETIAALRTHAAAFERLRRQPTATLAGATGA